MTVYRRFGGDEGAAEDHHKHAPKNGSAALHVIVRHTYACAQLGSATCTECTADT